MIEQQLYLDGELMDLAENTSIVLDIKSNLFRDISKMTANTTYTIQLPKTAHNMAVLEFSGKPKTGGNYPFQFHKARYFRNGLEIIKNGKASVLNIGETIEISIYWGLFPALTSLQSSDIKLTELNCPKYLRFTKNNQADNYEDAMANGAFYALYDTAQVKGISEEWQSFDITQGGNDSKLYELSDGKIRTGEEVGKNVSGEVIADLSYRCVLAPFVAGQTASIYDVLGKGIYRTWAVLDKNMDVIELADVPTGKEYTVGQAYESYNEGTTINGVPTYTTFAEAGDVVANNYPVSMTVISITIGLGINCPAGSIEYGLLDIETGNTEKWGEIMVSAKLGTVKVNINRYKEQGKLLYLRPLSDKMVFYDLTSIGVGEKVWGYRVDSSGIHQSTANWKYSITYTSENEPLNVNLQAPASAAYIIINTMKMFSEGTSLKIQTNTETSGARGTSGGGSFGGGGSTSGSSSSGGTSGGGSFGGGGSFSNRKGPIQPSVSVKYVLELITAATHVNFAWSEEAAKVVNSLAIPLVTRKADSNTLDGGIEGKLNDTQKLGALSLMLTKEAQSLFEQSANVSYDKLKVATDCSLIFDVQMYWSFDPTGMKPSTLYGGKVYRLLTPCYIEMKVVAPHTLDQEENEYTETYIIGSESAADKSSLVLNWEVDKVNGKFIHLIAGRGTLDLEAGTIITFEAKRTNGALKSLNFYGGKISADVQVSDEVPYGGNYPIGKNLPDISVIDFIKFLSVITATFPMQNVSDGVLKMTSIDELTGSTQAIKAKAVDWSKRLIPSYGSNLPKQTDFSVEDYCQHNNYKWKEDDTVSGSYDADLAVDNPTLEYSQDVSALPFAASDGNRVPIYEWESVEGGTFGGVRDGNGYSRSKITYQAATKYKACKDRIMSIFANNAGKAALRFDIDLQNIFDTKLAAFRKMLANPRQITERFRLSDFDILNFDETKPIYLAQYGCYFAVLEIKSTDSGYSEVTMIEIY